MDGVSSEKERRAYLRLDNNLKKKSTKEKEAIKKKEQQWLKENKEAIEEHNKLVEKYGCFSDAYRRF